MPFEASSGGSAGPMPTLDVHADSSSQPWPAQAAPGPVKPPHAGEIECATPMRFAWSAEGAERKMGTLRTLAGKYMGQPGILSFSGGFPTHHLFPYTKMSVTTADGTTLSFSAEQMQAAQQYNHGLKGYGPLVAWAEDHTRMLHSPPPAAGHQVLITNGGNHSLDMVFALFLDRGDSFLVEEYSYPVAVESIAGPKGYAAIGVPIDSEGIIPAALERTLAELHAACFGPADGGSRASLANEGSAAVPGTQQQEQQQEQQGRPRFPKLLYTIPHGQNPTGCTIPLARKKEVYAICQWYNIVILEDDPYVYLQYKLGSVGKPGTAAADVPGLHGLGGHGSYLSLDTDARVVRADSFAKFMAPGLRLGWITAHPSVVDKLVCTIQQHTVGPCSLTQVLVAETLEAWGEAGLDAHLRVVQAEYARRAAGMLAAAARELTGLAEWAAPSAGMFLWLRLVGEDDAAAVWEDLSQASVIVMPGKPMHWRCADPTFHSPYLRVSFSLADDATVEEGMRRIGAVLRRRRAAAAAMTEG